MTSLDWWLRDRTADGTPQEGRRAFGAFPNAAIWVFLATLLARLGPWDRDAELVLIGRGALVVWGLDELLRGVNPMRRVLGAVVLGWQLVAFVRG